MSAGNGVGGSAALGALAAAFGGAIGGSGVAGDNGRFTRDKRVGAAGNTVRASAYIAFGSSRDAQLPHGMNDCRHAIPMNLDGSVPFAPRAHLRNASNAQASIAPVTEPAKEDRAAPSTRGQR
ncbi:FAD-binding protein, partial [Burkholderia pseudomallei]|uniref:FAD-binding protein n=1 Tax=Burkholderia pseudomallei TaxID=28450 RepID=UPI0021F7BBAE